ncbi:MAG: C69 family dipeptidase, partial [Prevotellaceae bacterium]|nr:C69 family dipeptidase [Prevotellaceae bacterium]
DDANGVAYVPFYCTCERVPDAFDDKRSEGGGSKFSFKSAFWMCNWVSNMVYQRYNLMIDDLRLFRDGLDDDFENRQASIEKEALALYNDNPAKAREMLTGYTEQCTTEMMDTWMQLAQFLIVKYNDFKVLESEGKVFKEGWGHFHNYPVSEEFRRQAVNTSGDRFRVRKKEDNNVHQDVMSK